MRPTTLSVPNADATTPAAPRSDWSTLKKLLPYVWQWRYRVGLALAFFSDLLRILPIPALGAIGCAPFR